MSVRYADKQNALWAAAAHRVKSQRPQHTAATRAEQRRRISAWVDLWLNDEEYRRAMVIACLPGRKFLGRRKQ